MQFVPIYYHVLNITTIIFNLPDKTLRSIYSLRHRKCFVRRYIQELFVSKALTRSYVYITLLFKQLVNIDRFTVTQPKNKLEIVQWKKPRK